MWVKFDRDRICYSCHLFQRYPVNKPIPMRLIDLIIYLIVAIHPKTGHLSLPPHPCNSRSKVLSTSILAAR